MISVILPTYNESGNIIKLIKKISQKLKIYNFEIIVVDDNSPDQTGDLAKREFSKNKNIKIFIREKGKDLASAILLGINKSEGEEILVMDSDFNHDPEVLPIMLAHKDSYDLVVGSRYIKGGGMEDRVRFILSFIYNLLIRSLLHLKTHDNLSGFFLLKRKHLAKFEKKNIFYGYGEYFIRLLTIAHKHNLSIYEVPVFYKNRSSGESKSKFIPMFIDYSKTVIQILGSR